MSKIIRCVCCNHLKPRKDYDKGCVCRKCVSLMFTPIGGQVARLEGEQLSIDFD